MFRPAACLATAIALFMVAAAAAFELPASSGQCVVGIAEDWNSSTATLRFYQKKDGRWVPQGDSWQARLGKSGLVWGLGLHPLPKGSTVKKEGDQRAPAGVFPIGGAGVTPRPSANTRSCSIAMSRPAISGSKTPPHPNTTAIRSSITNRPPLGRKNSR
jgi:L,D-peptidoglycan transpeptidase YkuD (ErfK/YbiS/YcfS/YnhG family)